MLSLVRRELTLYFGSPSNVFMSLLGALISALMLDLRTDFSLPCKLIAEEHFLYDSIFTRI